MKIYTLIIGILEIVFGIVVLVTAPTDVQFLPGVILLFLGLTNIGVAAGK